VEALWGCRFEGNTVPALRPTPPCTRARERQNPGLPVFFRVFPSVFHVLPVMGMVPVKACLFRKFTVFRLRFVRVFAI
jgi:hypothetical protein